MCILPSLVIRGLKEPCILLGDSEQAFAKIFAKFSRNHRGFRKFFEVLGLARTCSDLFGSIRMRSDAFGCIWMHSDAFGHFRTLSENFENIINEEDEDIIDFMSKFKWLGSCQYLRSRHMMLKFEIFAFQSPQNKF